MSAMRTLFLAFAIAALTMMSPALGQSRSQPLSLKNHNSDAPVDVAADRIEVQDRADRAIFSGNVVVRQAELTLNAARLTVAYANTGGIQIQRLDASGGVTVRSPSETARGQFAIYDLNKRIITLIGAVTLTRGASHVSGARLVLDLDSGRAVMDGGGAPGTTSQGGRVTGTFTVPKKGS
jgi:lipopolysaccharide export system protein LptA